MYPPQAENVESNCLAQPHRHHEIADMLGWIGGQRMDVDGPMQNGPSELHLLPCWINVCDSERQEEVLLMPRHTTT
eukprot:7199749-Karenia_brevis.AAC.1